MRSRPIRTSVEAIVHQGSEPLVPSYSWPEWPATGRGNGRTNISPTTQSSAAGICVYCRGTLAGLSFGVSTWSRCDAPRFRSKRSCRWFCASHNLHCVDSRSTAKPACVRDRSRSVVHVSADCGAVVCPPRDLCLGKQQDPVGANLVRASGVLLQWSPA